MWWMRRWGRGFRCRGFLRLRLRRHLRGLVFRRPGDLGLEENEEEDGRDASAPGARFS